MPKRLAPRIVALGMVIVSAVALHAAADPGAESACALWARAKAMVPPFASQKTWEVSPNATPWPGRDNHAAVVLGDSLWFMGGRDTSTVPDDTFYNDVWRTQDGDTWTRTTEHAAWAPRFVFTAVAYDDKIWVMGGSDGNTPRNDVYNSPDGINWTQATAGAAWTARTYLGAVVYDGRMWIMGGASSPSGVFTVYNDVWYSTNGKDWARATASAAWPARYNLEVVVFDNKMWVIGGYDSINSLQDVWYSENGNTWTQATATAAWGARLQQSVAVYDGRLWLTGGYPGTKDVWYSEDGANWFQGEQPAWDGLLRHNSAAFRGKLYIVGGQSEDGANSSQVWSYQPNSGMGCGASSQRTSSTVPLGDAIALTAVLLLLAAGTRIKRGLRAGAILSVLAMSSASAEPATPLACAAWQWAKTTLSGPFVTKAWDDESPAAWDARTGQGSAVLGGTMWMYGGRRDDTQPNDTLYNDVWSTQDGSTWTRAIEHATWSPRSVIGAAAYDGAIWAFGGFDGTNTLNDVYRSPDGINWTQVTASATWPARSSFATVVFDDRLWVLGGALSVAATVTIFNDVWYTDNGKDWARATADAGWAKRYLHKAVVFDGKMWVLGGSDTTTSYRDVWYSDDGNMWTQATASAPWSARIFHSVAVYNGRFWLTGGSPGPTEVWYSDNGASWLAGETPAWDGRIGHSSHAFSNKLYLFGGRTPDGDYTKEVWTYTNGSAMGCGGGSDQGRTALPLGDVATLTAGMLVLSGLWRVRRTRQRMAAAGHWASLALCLLAISAQPSWAETDSDAKSCALWSGRKR